MATWALVRKLGRLEGAVVRLCHRDGGQVPVLAALMACWGYRR
jgi:hypothetical protein